MKLRTLSLSLTVLLLSAAGLSAVYADDTKPAASNAQALPRPLADDTKPAASDAQATSKSAAFVNDSIITTRVKMALLEDQQIPSLDISVRTDRGVVTLAGAVKTPDTIERAVHLASIVDGVKDVRSSIVVSSTN